MSKSSSLCSGHFCRCHALRGAHSEWCHWISDPSAHIRADFGRLHFFSGFSKRSFFFFLGTKAWRKSSTQTGFWGCCSGCINYCIPWWMGHCWGEAEETEKKETGWLLIFWDASPSPDMTADVFFSFISHPHSHTHGTEAKSKQSVMNVDPLTWS